MKQFPLLLVLVLSAAAQTSTLSATDPRVLLGASISAYNSERIRDVTATGTMTRFVAGQPLSAPVILKATKSGDVRLEATFDGLPKVFIFSGGFAQSIDVDGKRTFHTDRATAIRLITLPVWTLANALSDSGGKVRLKSSTSESLTIWFASASSAKPLTATSRVEICLNPKTMLLTRLASTVVANQPGGIGLPYELTFDDYRIQEGSMIPFSITERVNGQKTWTITLHSVTTNTGLTDVDFAN